ncbi:MAG: Trm112 family protein [Ignavibacteria bacterium]|jgi:uncharacterized protein YbaR (Trm112 family)
MIDPKVLETIRCPLGKKELKAEDENTLVCTNCGMKFPIIDGVPVLLLDQAKLPEGVTSISELKC